MSDDNRRKALRKQNLAIVLEVGLLLMLSTYNHIVKREAQS